LSRKERAPSGKSSQIYEAGRLAETAGWRERVCASAGTRNATGHLAKKFKNIVKL
jgi:hypothetical protein